MKDKILTTYFLLQGIIMNWLKIKPSAPTFPVNRSKYQFFFDDFNKAEFDANFYTTQPWGRYEPSNPKQWYDDFAVKHTEWGIELDVNSNLLIDKNTKINTGVGLVCSKFTTSYGLYIWNVNLPKGIALWPAIWLTNSKTWPPEIDVMEGYSDEKGMWGNRLKTNIYYGETPNQKSIRGAGHGWLVDKNKTINLKLLWLPNVIEIYYNNFLVRKITDPAVLEWLNKEPSMYVIMNNAIIDKVENQIQEPFIIQSFQYYEV